MHREGKTMNKELEDARKEYEILYCKVNEMIYLLSAQYKTLNQEGDGYYQIIQKTPRKIDLLRELKRHLAFSIQKIGEYDESRISNDTKQNNESGG